MSGLSKPFKILAAILTCGAIALALPVARDWVCLTRCIMQGDSFHYLDDELTIIERAESLGPPAVIVVASSGESGGVLSVGRDRNSRIGYWLDVGPGYCELLRDCRNEATSNAIGGVCSSYDAVNKSYEVAFRFDAVDSEKSFVYFGPRMISPALDKFAREYSGSSINCHE